jgi:hypothetical protein
MRWSRVALAAAAGGTLAWSAAPAALADSGGRHQVPNQVFAPYFESYSGDNAGQLAAESGARYQVLAFLQTDMMGSCTVYWNGDTATPVAWSTFGSEIRQIRALGGDVWPSFGGYTADTFGTEIADSCTDVNAIAQQYEKVITTYDFTRLDMDVETDYCGDVNAQGQCVSPGALQNTAGIDRRNRAIAIVEDWAAEHHRPLQVVYTLPVAQSGPLAAEDFVLQNAIADGARVSIVNIMTFDYYGNEPNNMVLDTETAAQGLVSELRQLHPDTPTAQLWRMVGVTEMIGIDDYGPDETLSLDGARAVEDWASDRHIALVSFWALQRDSETGSPASVCPFTGTQATWPGASGDCSSVVQEPWEYSHIFERFPRG